MPYLANRCKVVHYGLIAGVQSWSVSFTLSPSAGSFTNADMNGLANACNVLWLLDVWSSTAPGILAKIPSYVDLRGTKAYWYTTGSKTAAAEGGVVNTATPGTGSPLVPVQIATVATLLTNLGGRGNRGRVYLPATSVASMSNGRADNAFCDSISNSIATYIRGQNGVTVGSATFNSIVGGGTGAPITTVRVDNVLDTQRRRRDKVLPTYSKTTSI